MTAISFRHTKSENNKCSRIKRQLREANEYSGQRGYKDLCSNSPVNAAGVAFPYHQESSDINGLEQGIQTFS